MPFGFGPSDFITLIRTLKRLANILRSEAMDSWKRSARTYKPFPILTEHFDAFALSHDVENNKLFRHTRREIELLQQKYSGEIRDFKTFLGRNRIRKSLRVAVAKFVWSRKDEKLGELRHDLETCLLTMNIAMAEFRRQAVNVTSRES
ncbi:hypothetical protein G7Y89_g14498 [Cudoniella acicularis]|uniref:Uncharacterized protein n=1 Tax=Cudoniella acicularis TaxID=354080 RepID=A0A8H4R1X5_9HELO|nr:hypothetical protein G7Y89_g14498 [Cudoniella acicularis]